MFCLCNLVSAVLKSLAVSVCLWEGVEEQHNPFFAFVLLYNSIILSQ